MTYNRETLGHNRPSLSPFFSKSTRSPLKISGKNTHKGPNNLTTKDGRPAWGAFWEISPRVIGTRYSRWRTTVRLWATIVHLWALFSQKVLDHILGKNTHKGLWRQNILEMTLGCSLGFTEAINPGCEVGNIELHLKQRIAQNLRFVPQMFPHALHVSCTDPPSAHSFIQDMRVGIYRSVREWYRPPSSEISTGDLDRVCNVVTFPNTWLS